MKKALCLLMAILMALGLAACTAPAATGTPSPEVSASPVETPTVVVFSDAVLETRVREAMNKPEGDITIAEAETVTELRLNNEWPPPEEVITDISALKHFVNLKNLEIQFHGITDISPLAGLTKLESLGIGGNNISDISPLANLKELQFLAIFNCQASDYSALANLERLRMLFIEWSTIEDLSVLSGMNDLETLSISNTQVYDLLPIANLTKLKSLKLENSRVASLAPIAAIYPNLTEKDFDMPPAAADPGKVIAFADPVLEKKVREATGILEGDITAGDAAMIIRLDLSNEWAENVPKDVKFSNLGGIENFINLKALNISLNEVSDIQTLAGLTRMEDLDISINGISDISVISNMAGLKKLTMYGNRVSDLSPIQGLNLNSLHISNNKVSDISVLAGMTEMYDLYISDNNISDISALSGMKNLNSLLLSGNPVTDFSPIADIYQNINNKDFELK